MAQLKTIDTNALANLTRVLVGVDRLLGNTRYTVSSNYPPHNIVKYNDYQYSIDVAVAGFSKDEITVDIDHNVITVRGEHTTTDNAEYLYKGLAARDFVVEFPLMEHMIVQDATVKDGMLKISIEYVVPEALKPRRIEIN